MVRGCGQGGGGGLSFFIRGLYLKCACVCGGGMSPQDDNALP